MSDLSAAAFGDDPGHWPLPPVAESDVPEHRWLRAVAAGGQGRYSTANTELSELLRARPGGRLAALALSTRASFLRQLGWHRLAHDWDGRAVASAGTDPEARADALIGLAADALGVGRLATSAALLQRAAGLVDCPGAAPPPRQPIRLAWVRAELAMAAGDGDAAVGHARRAVELAEAALPGLRRHRVKSDVVLAAALCCAGNLAASRTLADATLEVTAAYRLVPLRWALACLLADIGSDALSRTAIAEVRDVSADFVTRHGGRWRAAADAR